jgi:hypothetical protein
MSRFYSHNSPQYSEGNRSYERGRSERWSPDDFRGARATWREDSSNRVPNRSSWGERSSYQQQPYSPNFSGQSGEYDYDQNWQGNREYDESVYGNDWQSRRYPPWNEEHENFSGQQDYHLGGPEPRHYPNRDRGENARWGQPQSNEWQPSWQGRSQAYGDSAQFGYRQSAWRGGLQPSPQNYEYGYGRDQQRQRGTQSSGAYGLQQDVNYRGRAPKGYVRTDERIREEICECLSDDPRIDASEISVEVREGVVTLEGSVQDRGQKHRAEDIADNCSGVKDVHNGLRVTRLATEVPVSTSGASPADTSKNRETTSGKNH